VQSANVFEYIIRLYRRSWDIFNPGFTTKQRGWGMGLALTRRIVKDYHGGEIRLLESQPGKGSTFLVRFPVS